MTTWTIQKDGQTVRELTLSDTNAMKVAGWAISVRHNAILDTPAVDAVPAELDEDGNVVTPAVDAQPAVMRDPTPDEAIGFQAEDFFASILSNATKFYQDQAVAEAIASVDPITPVS